VKLTVISEQGKEAIIAILSRGDFFGEECMAGQSLRMATASAVTDCSVVRLEKRAMIGLLRGKRHEFSEFFVAYLLSRNIRFQEDLVLQVFNSSEKRLARILLSLARFSKEAKHETVIRRISQETLAQMPGTTRSRVSHFMNRFRAFGFIDYNGGLQVHSSLFNVVLHN
jgi:CRP/FNR family cyclic AMP-dependent transcriptional regulator